jgi:hypothetical protein
MNEICKQDLQELDDLFDAKLAVLRAETKGNKELNDNKFKNLDEARIIAANLIDKRLESMNEIRRQLDTQALTFLSKDVYEARHDLLQKQLDNLEKKIEIADGKNQGQSKGINMVYVWVVGSITLIGAIVALVLNAIRLFSNGL